MGNDKRQSFMPKMTVGIWMVLLLVVSMLASLYIGIRSIGIDEILNSIVRYDSTNVDQLVVQSLRMPRMLSAFIVGISFAVSGALMQGVTNNPMASPSVLGITSGASFGLAVGMIVFPDLSLNGSILFAFSGAALATLFILLLAKQVGGRATPVYLALAGTAISTVFVAITHMLVVFFQVAQELSFWTAGGISGVRMEQIFLVLPWTIVGLILAMYVSKGVTLLSFGEEVAIGLGSKLQKTRLLSGLAVLILSGSAVALAGPIGFVGLVVPHITRKLIGIDYRFVIPFSALLGSVLVMIADILARVINPPFETPLGAITAIVGVPFFIYLANRKGGK
ncbi:FecCD family ABC transporter permease [Veillonella agrestimuris]|uniref:FecCD family ABC transporter permease n=1 Tax=Veillonella agrestimuris TaxID=2941340 RepID=UPI00203A9D7A|nr:iron ABC transporter permease [Veillonella agrestimuris]